MKEKIIVISSDHNGFELKAVISDHLRKKGIIVIDIGPFEQGKKVDYVDYANQLCEIITNSYVEMGILICGTGVGMSIAANRFQNIRAALVHNVDAAALSREHNNSNVLCLGKWTTSDLENIEIVNFWLDTKFGEGRHVPRIEKLNKNKTNVVFTNGVFDILHTGHVELLNFSKSLGDKLIVGINSDASVRKLKGDNRPINNENDRKKILEAISSVDQAIIFNDVSTEQIIKAINPSIIVKGGEWTADEVRERDKIPDNIEIKIFPFVKNFSTTNIVKKIHSQKSYEKDETNL